MKAPDGREIFVWRGRDHKDDIARLADTIAATVPGLVDRGGSIGRADADGQLRPAGPDVLRDLIGQHICGARLVVRGGIGAWEFYSYPFAHRPRMGYPTNENPRPDAGLEREPWAEDLDEIFRHQLPWRIPKIIE